ncbi:MAG: hemerythrin domain-containing protein [Motilibacteraceae bacterium]
MDICTVILEDHAEQRGAFAILDEVDPRDAEKLGPLWNRLAVLLEVHAEAEEKLFYPRLLKVGTGASDADSASDETEDAIHDHNEIRDAVREVSRHEVASDDWWKAVTAAREANSDHMAEEEREALADFRRHADLRTRHEIGLAFRVYEAQHYQGITPEDHDPKAWVAEHSG